MSDEKLPVLATGSTTGNSLTLIGIVPPAEPVGNKGVLYKYNEENDLWWFPSTGTSSNISLDLGERLNVYTVHPHRPATRRNFNTIQAAIDEAELNIGDAASGRATIYVAAETYNDNVTISKRVDIIGVGSDPRLFDDSDGNGLSGFVIIAGLATFNAGGTITNVLFRSADAITYVSLGNFAPTQTDNIKTVVLTKCNFIGIFDPFPIYSVNWTADQTADRNAGIDLIMRDCNFTGGPPNITISHGNNVFLERCKMTSLISINPIAAVFTENEEPLTPTRSRLVETDCTTSMAGSPIEIGGIASDLHNIRVLSLTRCHFTTTGEQPVIISTLDDVSAVLVHCSIDTDSTQVINFGGTNSRIYHRGNYSTNDNNPDFTAEQVIELTLISAAV